MEKKKCLECGYEFVGRADKKFCSDQCRNAYNNRMKRDANNFIRSINKILRNNRLILETLNKTGKTKVHKSKLLSKGFNFDYFTNIYRTKKGKIYYFCYEQGYIKLDNEYYTLVIKKDYVDGN